MARSQEPGASGQDTSGLSRETGHNGQSPATIPPDTTELIADMLAPGQAADEMGRLGPYRVLKLLDSGGMGSVFLAEDEQLQRRVALKAMKPTLAASQEARQRFLREARAAAGLRHDNIVTIHAVGEDRGTLWLAMELLEGESLKSRLERDKQLQPLDAVRIARQTAEALAASHHRGLIHRDIKPANIWLENSSPHAPREECISRSEMRTMGRVKVLDFGLARAESDDAHLTTTGIAVGTPAYMAPEQARGENVDHRCDLFSLGCVLYRMLTGRSPFRGKDTLAMLMSLAQDLPPAVRESAPDVPAELETLVAKLLSKDPANRPQTAAEVAHALARIETHLTTPIAGSKPAPGASVPTTELAETSILSAKSPPLLVSPSPLRRVPRIIALATATAALLIALGIVLTLTTPHGEVIVELADGVKPEEVKIEVTGNGELKIADAKSGWTIDVKEGKYNVQLAGSTDKFDIDQNNVTVTRNQESRVKVTLKPTAAAKSVAVGSAANHGNSTFKPSPGNYALETTDADSYIAFPALPYSPPTPLTVEGFVTPRTVTTGNSENSRRFVFLGIGFHYEASGHWLTGMKTGINTGVTIDTTTKVQTGHRTHLATVWKPGALSFYIDGKHVQTARAPDPPANKDPNRLPRNDNVERSPFLGVFDEFRVSTVARYEQDFTPVDHFESDKHTLALYHFDEGIGDVARDASGNGHHGKITAATWVKEVAPGKYAAYDADRRAAEWALSVGGTVRLKLNGPMIEVIDALPESGFRLHEIDLSGIQSIRDGDLVNLRGSNAEKLHLNNTQLTGVGFDSLASMPNLTRLSVQSVPLTDVGLERLKRTRLTQLYITAAKLTDAALPHLRQITTLTNLQISGRFTDSGISELKELTNLTSLEVASPTVSDEGLAWIAALPRLTRLRLQGRQFTDRTLVKLAVLTQLKQLELTLTSITAAGTAELQKSLPNCKIDWDGGTIQPDGVSTDPDRRAAEWAVHFGCGIGRVGVWDGWLFSKDELPAEPFQVQRFMAGLGVLLDEEAMRHLEDLERLEYVFLNNSRITDAGLKPLAKLPKLGRLTLQKTAISDAGLETVGKVKTLFDLDLQKTKITDVGLTHLGNLQNLQSLNLCGTAVTSDAIKTLQAKLPYCRIAWDGNADRSHAPREASVSRSETTTVPDPDRRASSNYALQFDGSDQSGLRAPDIALDVTSPATFETFIVPLTVPNVGGQRLVNSEPFCLMLDKNGRWFFDVAKYDRVIGAAGGPARAELRTRVHLAGVWTAAQRVLGAGNELHLFVDGKRMAWRQVTESIEPGKNIGLGIAKAGSSKFNGIVDEVRVSKVVRYQANFAPQQRFEADADTIALYHFDEGQGDIAYDSSGNAHHLEIGNAKWVPGIAK